MTVDRSEILNLKHTYCHTIDRGDYEGWVDLFANSGTFGRAGGNSFTGKSELQRFATDIFEESYDHSAHFLSNPVIETGESSAKGSWYLLLFYVRSDGTRGWQQGYYNDEYVRTEDGWKIDSTVVSFEYDRQFGGFSPVE